VKPYTAVTIIYNPKSTGPSEANARGLAKQLEGTPVAKLVKVIPTEFAGHAEELAYTLSTASKRPLIISSSGDGGYNEVVNGVLKAQAEGYTPTCGLLPSGNANDHYHNLHQEPVAEQIVKGRQLHIDVLCVAATVDGQAWQRYAHSYIGIGLTPKVGHELNKVKLNRWRESWIVLKTLQQLRTTRLKVHGKERGYDSLIFSNVGRMSKILSLSSTAELTDGKFEVISFPSHNKMYLIRQLLKAVTVGLHTTRHADHYTFETIHPTQIQLDGEIYKIDGGSAVKVTLEPKSLHCII
jgi:diacylglycerol kinase (ATP)